MSPRFPLVNSTFVVHSLALFPLTMRFAAVIITTLAIALAACAAEVPPVVKNIPDGGTAVPEPRMESPCSPLVLMKLTLNILACTLENFSDYIEKCTAQYDEFGMCASILSSSRCPTFLFQCRF